MYSLCCHFLRVNRYKIWHSEDVTEDAFRLVLSEIGLELTPGRNMMFNIGPTEFHNSACADLTHSCSAESDICAECTVCTDPGKS